MAATSQTPGNKPIPLYRQYAHEYAIWVAMHQRCENPRAQVYKHYGARGVRVCGRWSGKHGFEHFIKDIGPQPFKRASVHRIDNDSDYTPVNTVWANAKTQARNMSTNRVLEYQGVKKILVEWAEWFGMKPGTLAARLRYGWTVEEALTKSVEPRKPFSPWARRKT